MFQHQACIIIVCTKKRMSFEIFKKNFLEGFLNRYLCKLEFIYSLRGRILNASFRLELRRRKFILLLFILNLVGPGIWETRDIGDLGYRGPGI